MIDLQATIWRGPLALLLGIVALVLFFGDDGVDSGLPGLSGTQLAARGPRPASTDVEPPSKPAPRSSAGPHKANPSRLPRTQAATARAERHTRRLGPAPTDEPPSPSPRAATRPALPPVPELPAGAPLPPASAGSNGSYTPPATGKKVTPANIQALERRERMGLAVSFNSIAFAAPSAPARVKQAIAAANEIVGTPYIWGGGHGAWHSAGYDCSGAVSYALAGGGFLSTPLTSVGLETWGDPGPGRWITVYANAEHAYAVIDGLRWDTVGDAAGSGPRWHPLIANASGLSGFVERHPPGY